MKKVESRYGKIKNVNVPLLKRLGKYSKITIVGTLLATTITLSGSLISHVEANSSSDPMINKDIITLEETVAPGDSIYSIANKYYKEDYDVYYKSKNEYIKAIMDANDKNYSNIYPHEELSIPIIVDKNDPLYVEISNIEQRIKDLEQNNYWVLYDVKYGDNISSLASLASGSLEDTRSIVSQILKKNNMSGNDFLRVDTQIYIVNPERGKLVEELNNLKLDLAKKVTDDQKTI